MSARTCLQLIATSLALLPATAPVQALAPGRGQLEANPPGAGPRAPATTILALNLERRKLRDLIRCQQRLEVAAIGLLQLAATPERDAKRILFPIGPTLAFDAALRSPATAFEALPGALRLLLAGEATLRLGSSLLRGGTAGLIEMPAASPTVLVLAVGLFLYFAGLFAPLRETGGPSPSSSP